MYDWEMAAAANAAGAFKAKQSDGGMHEEGAAAHSQQRTSRGSAIVGLGKLVGKALEGGLAKIAQTAMQVGVAGSWSSSRWWLKCTGLSTT
jgi:hypothetical protein